MQDPTLVKVDRKNESISAKYELTSPRQDINFRLKYPAPRQSDRNYYCGGGGGRTDQRTNPSKLTPNKSRPMTHKPTQAEQGVGGLKQEKISPWLSRLIYVVPIQWWSKFTKESHTKKISVVDSELFGQVRSGSYLLPQNLHSLSNPSLITTYSYENI